MGHSRHEDGTAVRRGSRLPPVPEMVPAKLSFVTSSPDGILVVVPHYHGLIHCISGATRVSSEQLS